MMKEIFYWEAIRDALRELRGNGRPSDRPTHGDGDDQSGDKAPDNTE